MFFVSRPSLGRAKPIEETGGLSTGGGGLWSSTALDLQTLEFFPGLALLLGDSSSWAMCCFNRDFQEKSMPPPWRSHPPAPLPGACRVRHWAHLVFRDEDFDLINILWHGLLVPLDQGCLSPLDPSQELFQQLCVRHQLRKRRLQSLLVLLRPRENLLETQRRSLAREGGNQGQDPTPHGRRWWWCPPLPLTPRLGRLTSSNLARMMVIQCLIVVMQSGWQAARMSSPMPTAAFTSALFSSTFFMNS